jgi:hypothetical protein
MMKRGVERILSRGGDLGKSNWLNRQVIQAFSALEDEMLIRIG